MYTNKNKVVCDVADEIKFVNVVVLNKTIKKLGKDRVLCKFRSIFNKKKAFEKNIKIFISQKINFFIVRVYKNGFVSVDRRFNKSSYNLKMELISGDDVTIMMDKKNNYLGVIFLSENGREYGSKFRKHDGLFMV